MFALRNSLLFGVGVTLTMIPTTIAAPALIPMNVTPYSPAKAVGLDKRDITWPCGKASQLTVSSFYDCRPVATGSVVCTYTSTVNPGNTCNVDDYCSNFENFREGNVDSFDYNDSYDDYAVPTPFGYAKYVVDGDTHCLMANGNPSVGADGNTCNYNCVEYTESCDRCGGNAAPTTVMVCSTWASAC